MLEVSVEGFFWLLLVVVVVAFCFFVVRHKDDFEELLKRDMVEAREEAEEAKTRIRSVKTRFEDASRKKLTQKIKKVRALRGK